MEPVTTVVRFPCVREIGDRSAPTMYLVHVTPSTTCCPSGLPLSGDLWDELITATVALLDGRVVVPGDVEAEVPGREGGIRR